MAEGLFFLPTPFTPPTTEDDRSSWLRLIRSRRVGAVTFHKLLAEHGSAEAALAELPSIARAAGIENYAPCPISVIRHEQAQARACGARLMCFGEAGYPTALMDLPDAPPRTLGAGRHRVAEPPDGCTRRRTQCFQSRPSYGPAAG